MSHARLSRWVVVLGMVLASGVVRGEERFAVLIGANTGWANDRPLRYAERDAERMREVLVEQGGFPLDRVVVLRDPDTEEVRGRLQELTGMLERLGRKSLVVFYYSGHADERHLHLRGKPLSHAEVYRLLQGLAATVKVGVLDACRSGSILGAKGGRAAAQFEVKVVNELEVSGLAVLTSSGADELSQETKALAGSVFTHHLVSGLRGGADEDGNGEVTLGEAWKYAWQRTQADTAASQAPHRPAFLLEVKGQGELVLTRKRQGQARLVLPRGEGERDVVVDEHEVRLVAEARTQEDRRVELGLRAGAYRVKRVGAERLEVARVEVEEGQEVEAQQLRYEEEALARGVLKGEPEKMDEEERREWKKAEALKLLVEGEAGRALELFEQLLAQRPADVSVLRGRARALLRLAEAYDRVGDHQKVEEMLQGALVADPSLTADLDFTGWRSRLKIPAAGTLPVPEAPAFGRSLRLELGIDLVGPRGHGVVAASVVFRENWALHLGVDLRGPGFDVGVRYLINIKQPHGTLTLPLGKAEWAPFISLGRHLSFARLGLPSRDDERLGGGHSYQQLFSSNFHLDGGVQLVHEVGLILKVDAGLLVISPPAAQALGLAPVVGGGMGWHF